MLDGAKVPEVIIIGLGHVRLLLFGRSAAIVRILAGVGSDPALLALDEFGQVRRLFGSSYERMLQEFLGRRSLSGISSETQGDEILEELAEIALQHRWWVLGDEEEYLHRMNVGTGRFSVSQLECGDAQGPDIGLMIVAGLFDHLGSHPIRGTNKRVLLGHRRRQLTGHTKVGQLDLAVGAQENVGR